MKFSDILSGHVKVESSLKVNLTSDERKILDQHDDGFTELVIVI